MFDFTPLFEFSRVNCISICGVLVPLNLLLTAMTLVFVGMQRPQVQVRQAALLACVPAVIMILHVWTWLMIGVVMAPTFILFWLGSTCLSLNIWAMTHSQSMARLFRGLINSSLA
ncbi:MULTISPECIES: hypothetical protein [unclassified Coleofasciculus]|uniref:hypothetical protein n=1 Tax=unclassified Coleofasciculus TaxID=2692782 RepID=UPI00187FC358|nr:MULTISPECIES: hypothetical protein [unclassified Coleofasciculus]MBE9129994.1 hypothetical protein [Coleofasciculus sp. LEGE 07081]MBE9152374.1 hypothetical protein [Coleofasciculus sp. LEGE 07092]